MSGCKGLHCPGCGDGGGAALAGLVVALVVIGAIIHAIWHVLAEILHVITEVVIIAAWTLGSITALSALGAAVYVALRVRAYVIGRRAVPAGAIRESIGAPDERPALPFRDLHLHFDGATAEHAALIRQAIGSEYAVPYPAARGQRPRPPDLHRLTGDSPDPREGLFMEDAAAWFRVSTGSQDADNQVPDVEHFAAHHGYSLAERYDVSDSAWKDGGGAEYRAALKRALDDAHAGRFSVLVVWSLDRIVRGGAEEALRIFRQFRQRGCTVISVRESWLNGAPEVQEILIAFAGWMAQQESERRSERVKIGLDKRRAAGLPVGRQPGAVDKKQRKRSGYVAAWERRQPVAVLARAAATSQP